VLKVSAAEGILPWQPTPGRLFNLHSNEFTSPLSSKAKLPCSSNSDKQCQIMYSTTLDAVYRVPAMAIPIVPEPTE